MMRGLVLGCVGIGMEGGDIFDCRCSFLCIIYIQIIHPELGIWDCRFGLGKGAEPL